MKTSVPCWSRFGFSLPTAHQLAAGVLVDHADEHFVVEVGVKVNGEIATRERQGYLGPVVSGGRQVADGGPGVRGPVVDVDRPIATSVVGYQRRKLHGQALQQIWRTFGRSDRLNGQPKVREVDGGATVERRRLSRSCGQQGMMQPLHTVEKFGSCHTPSARGGSPWLNHRR